MIKIEAEDRKAIETLAARFVPGAEIWAFGSRVTGKARPCSDLDIAVFAKPGQEAAVYDLKEALEESDIPFRVDVLVWQNLPENFRRNITASHEVFMKAGGL